MGSKIVSIMQSACVFAVIAQMIFYFRPNESYEKYFKMLMGIFLLAVLFIPILQLFHSADEENFRMLIKKHELQVNELYQDIYSFQPENNDLEEKILERQKNILETEDIKSEIDKQQSAESAVEAVELERVKIALDE